MGLFSRKHAELLVHPAVARQIAVAAPVEAVVAQLEAYSEMQSPKHAVPVVVTVGSNDGWTTIQMPEAMHPWTFHNVAFWMLDAADGGADVIAISGPAPTHQGYRLVPDPDMGDCLCGLDDDGHGWTVSVPTNDIVRPEAVPLPAPAQVPLADDIHTSITVLLEDPGHDMNPANEATVKNRKALHATADAVMF